MKTGLVMEGGALRGLFTAGVIDVFMENGITFDGAVGVSAGATFGCNIKSGQIGRAIRYNMKYCKDKRYFSFWSLLFTGNLFGKKFCYEKIPNELDVFDNDAFEKNPMEFHIVCTNVETGEPVYKKCDRLDGENLNWVRASASLPMVSEVVEVDGLKLQDGGIIDSIPLKYFESIGFDRNVVILTQPKGYVKEPTSMGLFRISLRKYPKMIEALENRHNMYNETTKYIEEKEERGEIFVIRPKEILPVKRTSRDPEKLKAVYEAGREEALKNLDKIKDFLSK